MLQNQWAQQFQLAWALCENTAIVLHLTEKLDGKQLRPKAAQDNNFNLPMMANLYC